MTIGEILGADWPDVWASVIGTIAMFVAVIAYTRLRGLRSFAKMSTFDFAGTVATGTLVASVALGTAPLVVGLVALAVLYGVEWSSAILRRHGGDTIVDNEPVLLMEGTRVIEENMRRTRVTMDDLYAKLREANVVRLEQVRAVVLETTGDVSVLHADPDGPPMDEELLRGVRRGAATAQG